MYTLTLADRSVGKQTANWHFVTLKQKQKPPKTRIQHLAKDKQEKTNSEVTDMKQELAAIQSVSQVMHSQESWLTIS